MADHGRSEKEPLLVPPFEEIPPDQLRILRRDKLKFHLLRVRDALLRSLGAGGAGPAAGGPRQFCSLPWTETCILSDGTVVCSCFDVFKQVVLGDVSRQPFSDIWNGPRYRRLRARILQDPNQIYWCSKDCPFKITLPPGTRPPHRSLTASSMPRLLNIEPTVECNLDCPGCPRRSCLPTRRTHRMPFELYCRVIDQLGPHLKKINFFNYGETFMHPAVYRMLRYTKKVNPDVFIHSSTNGHFFTREEKRRELVESGIDEVMFSIDGATPESYRIYRRGGDFNLVIRNLAALIETRARLNSRTPRIIWRYILFRWNDSDEEMDRARRMARELGVDVFCFYLTDTPPGAPSQRFVPGTPDYERIKHELFVPE